MSPANFMVALPARRARLVSGLANGGARGRRAPAERPKRWEDERTRGPRREESRNGRARSKVEPAGGAFGRCRGMRPAQRGCNPFWKMFFRQNGAILPELKIKVPGTDGRLRR